MQDQLKKMNLDELKKQDFKVNGHAPKTTSFTGTALGISFTTCPLNRKLSVRLPLSLKM